MRSNVFTATVFIIAIVSCEEKDETEYPDDSKLAYMADYSHVLIEPSVGTMVSDKIAIGMAIGFFQTKSKSEHEDPDDYQSLSLTPFVRIHDSITDKFRIYLEPGFGKTFVLGDESDNKPQHYRARVDFGLLYFISQNLSLEINIAGINYIHMSDKDYGLKNNQFKIDYDLVYPNIGLKYYF